jgi:hypothetical protein
LHKQAENLAFVIKLRATARTAPAIITLPYRDATSMLAADAAGEVLGRMAARTSRPTRRKVSHRDHDFDSQQASPANEAVLTQDLELDTLFSATAGKDQFILEVAKDAILTAANDLATLEYRQGALKDCPSNPDIVR